MKSNPTSIREQIYKIVGELLESGYCEASHKCEIEHPKIKEEATAEILDSLLNSLKGKIKKGMNRLFEKYKPEGTTRADEDWQQREFIKTQKREVLNEVLSLLLEIKKGK